MGATDHPAPFLSVVVAARNDNRDGEPASRLTAFIRSFEAQCSRTGLDAEVIVVEWNPPHDRPRLSSLVRWPDRCACMYRFIEVPETVHATRRHAADYPSFDLAARNVGIRRARGRFVLATNPDVVLSSALIDFLVSEQLLPGRLYRTDRRDIEAEFPADATLDDQMRYCATHQLRVHAGDGTRMVDHDGRASEPAHDIVDHRHVRLGGGWDDLVVWPDRSFRWASDVARIEVVGDDADRGRPMILEMEFENAPDGEIAASQIEIIDAQNAVVARPLLRRDGVFQLFLDPARDRHRLEMRLAAGSDGRRHVAELEGRSRWYAIRSLRLERTDRSALLDAAAWSADGWKATQRDDELRIECRGAELAVKTPVRRHAYAIEYAPLRATAAGRYELAVEYVLVDGGLSIGLLNGDRSAWLGADVRYFNRHDRSVAVVSANLEASEAFRLVISNAHPDGDSPSQFIVRRLLTTGPLERTATLGTDRETASPTSRLVDAIVRPFERSRLGTRLSAHVLDNAPEVHALRERIATRDDERRQSLARINELESVGALRELEQFVVGQREDLHLNRCGDFQLMAREDWLNLRGYPELDVEEHGDELLSAAAHYAGIREHVLPAHACVFRLERETHRPDAMGPHAVDPLWSDASVPRLEQSTLFIWRAYMRWLSRPLLVNGSRWGLHGLDLPEAIVRTPDMPASPLPLMRHPVFEQFDVFEGWAEPGFERSFFGVNVREWLPTGEPKGLNDRRRVRCNHPPLCEEYFEWIALLVALSRARGRFCMAELGAGWGRWIVSAAAICRQQGLEPRLIAVEAEKSHFEWLGMVLRDNDVDPAAHQIRFGAVAAEDSELLLVGPDTPLTMYGHRTIRPDQFAEWSRHEGYVFRKVPAFSLATLLKNEPVVDLVDLDVQGVEHDVLAPAFDVLNEKVRIIHIGTHGRSIEAALNATFRSHGWRNAFSFSCASRAQTLYGEVEFGDGVQTWVNPKWPEFVAALVDAAPVAPSVVALDQPD